MKPASLILLLTTLALSSSPLLADPQSPRDLEHATAPLPTIRFINYYLSDFRLLFCSESDLAQRIQRSVCVVDRAGESKELALSPDDTVGTVLKRLGFTWNDAFQLRLIQKLEIAQSAMPLSLSDREAVAEANRHLLARRIFPGDIIVYTTIREWDRSTSGIERIKSKTSR